MRRVYRSFTRLKFVFVLTKFTFFIFRIIPVTQKTEQKTPATTNLKSSVTRIIPITVEDDVPKREANNKSIPDQQPAAPKVVLPVLEPSASSTNIPKQAEQVEEKDGHYFMKVIGEKMFFFLYLHTMQICFWRIRIYRDVFIFSCWSKKRIDCSYWPRLRRPN